MHLDCMIECCHNVRIITKMKSPAFQIRVAILGHVSVGKTTVLNALLGEKFSEISKKRTTAGINHFKIVSTAKDSVEEATAEIQEKTTRNLKRKVHEIDLTQEDQPTMSAADILAKISAENVELRSKNNTIQECTLAVEVPEQLFPMHENTRLIITDVPGVNEAGSSEMYLNYVKQVWDELDCVVVVMDADQGVNTEEQVKLLDFVQGNLKTSKMIPSFILCNKVDDPHDEELMSLVEEVRGKVNDIFEEVRNFQPALMHPTVMHVSAENAFAYRSASRLTRKNMHELNRECLDKIGYEEVGKVKWRRMTKKKKYDLVHEVVSDKTQYDERLALTNFDKFLEALSSTLGGSENQVSLIESQLKIQLKKLNACLENDTLFVDGLVKAFDCSYALGKPTGHLRKKFWTLYSSCEEQAFQKFEECPTNVMYLHKPMKELQSYAKGLHLKLFSTVSPSGNTEEGGKNVDEARMLNAMKGLVSRQMKIMSENEKTKLSHNPQNDPWCDRGGQCRGGLWYNNSTGSYRNANQNSHPESGLYCSHWEWKDQDGKWHNKYDKKDMREGSKDVNPALIVTRWETAQAEDWCAMINSLLLLKHNKYFCEDLSAEILELEMRKCFTTRFSKCAQGKGLKGMEVPMSLRDHNHFGSLAHSYCEFKKNHSTLK